MTFTQAYWGHFNASKKVWMYLKWTAVWIKFTSLVVIRHIKKKTLNVRNGIPLAMLFFRNNIFTNNTRWSDSLSIYFVSLVAPWSLCLLFIRCRHFSQRWCNSSSFTLCSDCLSNLLAWERSIHIAHTSMGQMRLWEYLFSKKIKCSYFTELIFYSFYLPSPFFIKRR